MTRQEALADLTKTLGCLRYQIGIENAAGYFSQNKLLENLILPVLKEVYRLPDLRNANDGKSNQAHIDLVADSKKVAWQITTERHSSKITDTLKGFVRDGLHKRYKRICFFIFSPQSTTFHAKTQSKWTGICGKKISFSPSKDIIQFDDLYRDISILPDVRVKAVRQILAESIVGEDYVDVKALLDGQALVQVQREKETGKYIPDIFVESSSIKELARSFWHPLLFLGEILDDCERWNFRAKNKFLEKCGLSQLPILDFAQYRSINQFCELEAATEEMEQQLEKIEVVANMLESIRSGQKPPMPCHPERQYFYEQNIGQLHNIGIALKYRTADISKNLQAIRARVFILTSKAGQGKTNFVCDFVENFATRHGIPCAYFTGVQLGRVTVDLPDHLQRTLFHDKATTFSKCAELLSRYAADRHQPFVFVFEGLNEHTRINHFAGQLEELINVALKYPQIRFFLTCRSEYFIHRFGNLARSSFSKKILTVDSLNRPLGGYNESRLIKGYFSYFKIDPDKVDEDVQNDLFRDTLLLRFFCEAYGARNRPSNYKMQYIAHLYRAEVFEYYLEQKLTATSAAIDRSTTTNSLRGNERDIMALVRCIVANMVTQRKFSDVPLTAIPPEMHNLLYFLIDEEIIIRRDIAAQSVTSLTPPDDVLNFIYDEFRDFLIAKYLVDAVYPSSPPDFLAFLAYSRDEKITICEGLLRFLFYFSRQPKRSDFWKFYSQQSTYAKIYLSEIFFICPTLHNDDDERRIREILEVADSDSIEVVRFLTWRGIEANNPRLNLKLLINVIANGDDARYDALIRKRFQKQYHFEREWDPLTKQWGDIFEEKLLPCFDPSQHMAFLQFMVLLFPLDLDGDLESPTVRLFRRVSVVHGNATQFALEQALQYRPSVLRPFLWRLLTEQVGMFPATKSLRDLALTELISASAPTKLEIQRFISCIPSP